MHIIGHLKRKICFSQYPEKISPSELYSFSVYIRYLVVF